MRERESLSQQRIDANVTQFVACVKHCFESRDYKTWQNHTVRFWHGKVGNKEGTLIALCPINRHTTVHDRRLQSLAQSRQCQRAREACGLRLATRLTKPRCHRDMATRGIGKDRMPPIRAYFVGVLSNV